MLNYNNPLFKYIFKPVRSGSISCWWSIIGYTSLKFPIQLCVFSGETNACLAILASETNSCIRICIFLKIKSNLPWYTIHPSSPKIPNAFWDILLTNRAKHNLLGRGNNSNMANQSFQSSRQILVLQTHTNPPPTPFFWYFYIQHCSLIWNVPHHTNHWSSIYHNLMEIIIIQQ